MLHIIILNKDYFPTKLNSPLKPGDKVIIISPPDGAIPVAAYRNDMLKDMEVKLLPDIKDSNTLRIAQAMLIGQITSGEENYDIYTDDNVLIKALMPFTGAKKLSVRKVAVKTSSVDKQGQANDAIPAKKAAMEKATQKTGKKVEEKTPEDVNTGEEKGIKEETNAPEEEDSASIKATTGKVKEGKNPVGNKKTGKNKTASKLPTQPEVKRFLGASNSTYSKAVMDVIKKSNQITFEMDLRMKLAEAGMDPAQCQDLARTLNEEFGKSLPASM